MEYKKRTKPVELAVLEILQNRIELSEKDKQYLLHLKKGYEGEVMFDAVTRELNLDCYVLNDLLLQVNHTTFQIDTLIIADRIYLYEVKNYDGDFYYDRDRIYRNKLEIANPLTQLNRTETLLRQLLQTLGMNFTLHASVVFINPEFTMYHAPSDKPIIFPTQLKRHVKQLNTISSRLTKKHLALAKKLASLHLKESPYSKLPKYKYEELRKGASCKVCGRIKLVVEGKHCICSNCNHKEFIDDAVLRSIEELRLLFPNKKITIPLIYDWCRITTSKKKLRRILTKKYTLINVNRWSYYQ
ncbi:NERD domain-containing protein [Ornithinibacillus sp. BX22]|uniref:NERD domain-containing protein n=1 Tax=Ornithinibacillus hominis TaxID=2763055 RepID=A0A923L8G4_9BACI|nr:nuclease-related domain-containing protein [Ornithinibacillus hominis]MBC5638487.1 NERD domain-containing protein [Ornithinibacillus hominis]